MNRTMPTTEAAPRWKQALAVLLTAIAFDRLFWQAGTGLNLGLFTLLVLSGSLALHGARHTTLPARVALVLTLLAGLMVVVHGTAVAIVGAVAGLLVTSALVMEPGLRSLPYALGQAVTNLFVGPFRLPSALSAALAGNRRASRGWRWFRIALVPVLVFVVYLQLYRVANPRFDTFTASFLDGFGRWLADAFAELFTPHLLFLVLAVLVAAGLLLRNAPRAWSLPESHWTDVLLRRRSRRPGWLRPLPMNALERERRRGILLLVLVNLLLVVVNIIDIHWFWTGFEVPEGFSLKQFVHEGTWVLVFSILLSMAILLHLFRANQNFHPKARVLRLLALLWVVQNFVLGVSVYLRNQHYISFHGLAYKRIGVIVFLVLVLVGLVTLFRKIHHRLSLYHLLRVNAWAAFVVLVALGFVDWDRVIVRHNLHHDNPAEIDIDNYLAMSDRVLPLLYADLDRVERQMEKHRRNAVRWVDHLDPGEFRDALDAKRMRFVERKAASDLRSWSWGEARALRELQAMDLDR